MTRVTDEHRALIRELHAQGLGRNAIAEATGLAAGTVTRIAGQLGLSFARSATAAATAARQVDLRDRRQQIVEQLYDRAQANINRLNGPEYRHRVQTATESFVVSDEAPPSPDERNHAQSINSYLTAAARLEAVDADRTSQAARSMLTKLGEALGLGIPPQAPTDG